VGEVLGRGDGASARIVWILESQCTSPTEGGGKWKRIGSSEQAPSGASAI
jgi:hypothetical protein